MKHTRIAAFLTTAAISVGGIGVSVPSAGASSHWSSSKCKSYVSEFKKHHKKPTSSQKKSANSTLKSHGCSQKV